MSLGIKLGVLFQNTCDFFLFLTTELGIGKKTEDVGGLGTASLFFWGSCE